MLSRNQGLPLGTTVTLQGIEEDPQESNPLRVSVTNALILHVE